MGTQATYRVKGDFQTEKVGEVEKTFETAESWEQFQADLLNDPDFMDGFDTSASEGLELIGHDESIGFESLQMEDGIPELIIDIEDGGQSLQQYDITAYITIIR